MSSVSFNRKKATLKQLLGTRARLALLALILVTPLMLERARSLEDTRSKQVELASAELANLAKHSADAQQEVISSVETLLKSAAYIRASAGGIGRSSDILLASGSGHPSRHFGGAGRQHRNRAGSAGGSSQHDRPPARYDTAVVGHCRRGCRFGPGGGIAFVRRR